MFRETESQPCRFGHPTGDEDNKPAGLQKPAVSRFPPASRHREESGSNAPAGASALIKDYVRIRGSASASVCDESGEARILLQGPAVRLVRCLQVQPLECTNSCSGPRKGASENRASGGRLQNPFLRPFQGFTLANFFAPRFHLRLHRGLRSNAPFGGSHRINFWGVRTTLRTKRRHYRVARRLAFGRSPCEASRVLVK